MEMAAMSVEAAQQRLHRSIPPWSVPLHLQVREITEASATLVMPFDEQLLHAGRMVAGPALVALADTAMVVALWAAFGGFRLVATIDLTTTFMRPVTHSAVVAEATVLRLGRTLGFCHVQLRTDTAERPLVAHAVGSYSIPPAS
jgi:uncharacterized protein (TIGR00369 family)